MGFVSTTQKQKKETSSGIETPQGLRDLGRERGIDVPTEKEQRKLGFLGGVEKVVDVLRTGEFVVGGLLSGKGPLVGIKEKISPSDVLLDSWTPSGKVGKISKGVVGLGLDVGLDPTTYLTLGTGGAVKVASKGGSKIAVSKTATDMMSDLAQETASKAARAGVTAREAAEKQARQTISQLTSKEAVETTLERGGLRNITTALEKSGQKVTRENVEKVLKEGADGLRAKGGLKWGGVQLAKAETLSKPFQSMSKVLQANKYGKGFFDVLKQTGNSLAKTFSRDYGLDDIAKANKQKFLNRIDFSKTRISEQIGVTFSGVTKAQREMISMAVEEGKDGIAKLPKELQPLAQRTRKIFDQISKDESKLGLLNSWVEDYVPHIYKNKDKRRQMLNAYSSGTPNTFLRFAKQRRIPTIKEAEELGLEPIKDVAEILNARLIASEKAKAAQDFYRTTVATKGLDYLPSKKVAELNEDFVQLGKVVKTKIPKELANARVPRYIAEDINKMNKRLIDDPDLSFLLKGYDKVLNYFKASVTVLFPSFHGRNAISNVSQNILDIGIQAMNPAKHKQAVDIMLDNAGEMTTKLGTKIPYKDIRKAAKEKGVLNNRVTSLDLDSSFRNSPIKRRTPLAAGRALGTAIEGEARMVNFLSNIERGMTFDDAALKAKEFLFDYDNLSAFEKDFMRRVIPFYTWTRKNIALQLKAMATVPGKSTAQMKTLVALDDMFGPQKTDLEKDYAPDFIREGMNVLISKSGDDRTFVNGFDLPFENVIQIFNKPLKEMIGMSAPILKTGIEAATGVNTFKERGIKEDDSGYQYSDYPDFIKDWLGYTKREIKPEGKDPFTIEKVDPQKKWLLTQLETFMGTGRFTSQGFLEPVKAMYKMLDGGEVVTLEDKWQIARFLVNIRAYTIDIEASKRAHENNDMDELERILERNGVIGRFEKTFVPADQQTPTKKKSNFSQ